MRWKTLLYMEASFLSTADCSAFSFFRRALMSLQYTQLISKHSFHRGATFAYQLLTHSPCMQGKVLWNYTEMSAKDSVRYQI